MIDTPDCVVCNRPIEPWVVAESEALGFAVEVCSAACSVELAQRRSRGDDE